MRALAEFIMRGRAQACGVAFLGSLLLLPMVAQAVLALVALRKGANEGLLVTAAATAPALLFVVTGMDTWTGKFFAIELFFVTYALALVLRVSVSLALAVVSGVLFSALGAGFFVALIPDVVAELGNSFTLLIQDIEQQQTVLPEGFRAAFTEYTATKAAGFFALIYSLAAIAGLFVGRWLQALLYMPGGFQAEFHNLRMNLPIMLVCVATAVIFEVRGLEYMYWANVSLLPLVVSGLAMVHFLAKNTKLGLAGLGVFYLSIALFPPFVMLVTLFFGLTDPVANYRKRFKYKQ